MIPALLIAAIMSLLDLLVAIDVMVTAFANRFTIQGYA